MGASAKLFGLIVFLAGFVIATYYTLWVSLQLPVMKEMKKQLKAFFLDVQSQFLGTCILSAASHVRIQYC